MEKLFRWFFLGAVFCLIFPTLRLPLVGISVSDLFIMAAGAIWAVAYIAHRGRAGWGIPMHPLWLPALFILVGGLLSSFNAVSMTGSIGITLKMFFVLTVWVAMGILTVRRGEWKPVIAAFMAAALFSASIALVDQFTHSSWGKQISGIQVNYYFRADGTLGHPVEFAAILSTAFPIMLGLLLAEWKRGTRLWRVVLYGIASAVIAAAIFLTGSVTGWLCAGLGAGILFLFFFLHANARTRKFFLALGALGLVVIVLFLQARGENIQFLLEFNLRRVATSSAPGRAELIAQAADVIAKNPLIGTGMDQTGTGGLAQSELVLTDIVHNVFWGAWLGGGILCAVGVLWAYLIVTLTGLNALVRNLSVPDWLIVGLAASTLAWLLFDQTQPHLYHRYTWLTLALLLGLGYQVSFKSVHVSTR